MDKSPVHIDEFGTIRFKVYSNQGKTYEFEQEADSIFLFVTVRDVYGRAETKKIVNTENPKNLEITETYRSYIKEETHDKTRNEEDKQ